eukprot:CFRG2745T1
MKCVNNACGKDYTEDVNTDKACLYHKGTPVFHEGLKGWSCCKKRTTDFSEFLSMPGCTEGRHVDTKPVETQDKNETVPAEEAQTHHAPMANKDSIDRSPESDYVAVSIERLASSKKAYDIFTKKFEEEKKSRDLGIVADNKVCEHKGCNSTYAEAKIAGDSARCVYHSGAPIFHEGFKSWSCCNIKTSDFQEFMNQKGCSEGTHLWHTQSTDDVTAVECRTDFFQGESSLTLSVFAKNVDLEQTTLKVSNLTIKLSMRFEGTKSSEIEIPLYKEIDPTKTTAKLGAAKLELVLSKVENGTWPQLTA